MKHRVKSKSFNRDTKSRRALLVNGVRSLVEHGHLQTSEARAKEIARLTNKLIAQAKGADLSARRQLHRFFGKRDVVNTLVDRLVPAAAERQSGFVKIQKMAKRRGDNTTVYRLELLVKEKTWSSLNNDARQEKAATEKKPAKKAKKAVKKTVEKVSGEKPVSSSLKLENLAQQERQAAKAVPSLRNFIRRKTGEK